MPLILVKQANTRSIAQSRISKQSTSIQWPYTQLFQIPTPLELLSVSEKQFTCLNLNDALFSHLLAPRKPIGLCFLMAMDRTGQCSQLPWAWLPQSSKASQLFMGKCWPKTFSCFCSRNWDVLCYSILMASTWDTKHMRDVREVWKYCLASVLNKIEGVLHWGQVFGIPFSQEREVTGLEGVDPEQTCTQDSEIIVRISGNLTMQIPGYAILAKSLRETTKRGWKEPLNWGKEQQTAFKAL